MKKAHVIGILILAIGLTGLAGCTRKMDRQELVDLMDQYLTALGRNDPSSLAFSDDVKFVENTEVMQIGEGLWETRRDN